MLFSTKEHLIADPLPLTDELQSFLSLTNVGSTASAERNQVDQLFVSCIRNVRPVLQCGLPVCGMVGLTRAQ